MLLPLSSRYAPMGDDGIRESTESGTERPLRTTQACAGPARHAVVVLIAALAKGTARVP